MTVSSVAQTEVPPMSQFSVLRLWQKLIAPPVFIPESEHRQVRLFNSLLVVTSVAILIGVVATLIDTARIVPDNQLPDVRVLFIDLVVWPLTLMLYGLSRTRHYRFAMFAFAASFGVVAMFSASFAEYGNLVYVLLGPLLASLLLSVRATALFSVINFVYIVVLIGTVPNIRGTIGDIVFSVVALLLMVVAAAIRERDRVQIEAQIAELAASGQKAQAARERAERSDKVKSAFLASMSHELRTPLNSIINFTKFVVEGDTGPVNPEQVELLTEVVGSAKHLLSLINDVLDMSKIEAGSLRLFVENNVMLDQTLNMVITTGRGLLAGKPVEIRADIPPDLPAIQCDRQRVLQILLNIMSNACKFTNAGLITVSARQAGPEVLVTIRDTGPGIAPSDQVLVFEAFKQTDSGLRQGGGTGLGMPIARSLAEAHGGRLWLESDLGKGATFHLALPIQSAMPVFA